MSNSPPSLAGFQQSLIEAAECLYLASDRLSQPLHLAAQAIVNSMTSGGKVICAGQGAGGWLAQQAAHYLVHGHARQRPPLAALDISVDTHPGSTAQPGSLSSRLTALGQSGDIWLVFAMSEDEGELLQATQAASELDMILLIVGPESDGRWSGLMRDTDMWLALPGSMPSSLFCSAWLALQGLCEAVDIHLLGEES